MKQMTNFVIYNARFSRKIMLDISCELSAKLTVTVKLVLISTLSVSVGISIGKRGISIKLCFFATL